MWDSKWTSSSTEHRRYSGAPVSLPKKGDFKAILIIGGFQMALFLLFAHVGIEHLHASQASILCYATSLFVVPLSFIVFGERPTRRGWLGVTLCLGGVLLPFSPWNYDWHPPHCVDGAKIGMDILRNETTKVGFESVGMKMTLRKC